MTTNYPIPTGNTDEAVEFLERMFPNRPRHLVAIDPGGRVTARTFSPDQIEEMRAWIDARQGEANLYLHVNELRAGMKNKKASKGDVAKALSAHVDIDDVSAESRLRAFAPPPTAIVASGGGFHGYWALAEATTDLVAAEAINVALAKALGGDNCHNIDRIMRLPGTVNLPNAKKQAAGRKPTLARVVDAHWSRRYGLAEFPRDEGPPPARPKGAVAHDQVVVVVDLNALPASVSTMTRALIEHGDDLERPVNGTGSHFRSRSEVVFRAACDLAREGCSESVIAGVLLNPAFGISLSIQEKRNPQQYALRQARSALAAVSNGWPDRDKSGAPRATMRNTLVALQRAGLTFSHDLFRHRKVVNGSALGEYQGEISDDACAALRGLILEAFKFDPRADNVRDAVTQLCLENGFHPVRQMLDSLAWDGERRINRWLATYLGAEDTPLNAAIGHIMLVAAVRRVRTPGVKFDTIIILEGPQGSGKSTALQILAGPENHSDNEILTLDTKGQMEAMEGVWIYELSEMSGLSRSEAEKTKAFASRQVDRARMAYGRFLESRPRQTIFVGTTNEPKYLKDRTGNRRFLPVRTGTIDLEALRRDRDQLLAEAAHLEAQGESIVLPSDLWGVAAAEQEERLEDDPWLEPLSEVKGRAVGDQVRVASSEVLREVLGIEVEHQSSGHMKRLAGLMRSLGWEPKKYKVSGKTVRGFQRHKPDDHVDDPPPHRPQQPF